MCVLPAFPRLILPARSRQKGASLLMVLILMLVISLLAIFGVRNVKLLERQTLNEQEYQLARQAAEAALRDAEADLRIPEPNGLYTQPGAACGRENSNFRLKGVASVLSDEFTDDCLRGQCGVAPARYAVAWDAANDSSNRGAPWWPGSKGGNWGNNADANGAPVFDCSTGTGGVPLGTYTGAARFTRVARQPEYLIELITPGAVAGAVASSQFECTGQAGGGAGRRKRNDWR